jgi:hydrogenase maturation protease
MAEVMNLFSSETSPTVVVIGYGNPRRGDDAVGQEVVARLQALKIPTVEAYSVPGLIPELAGKLAAADSAIFVDACKAKHTDTVRIKPLEACGTESAGSAVPALGHSCDPRSLLALAHSAYGRCPQAWWVEVPASDFTPGNALSALAERGVAQALQEIEGLINAIAKTLTP